MLRPMLEHIDVAMTPNEAQALEPAQAYVVIDALRATTTIAALFSRRLRRLRVVSTLDAARSFRASGATLLGETGGLRPEGFDYGNSPAEAAALDWTGREAVLVTSNGTKAICAVAGMGAVAAGSLVNLSALADWAGDYERLMVVCAGEAGARTFALEDFAVAACLVAALRQTAPEAALGDGALVALELAEPRRFIGLAGHAEVTRRLGFASDLAFATTQDRAPALPIVVEHGDGWAMLEDRLATD